MSISRKKSITYKDSGVDIDQADSFVESIKPYAKMTARPEVLAGIGGFGALCALPKKNYKDPILVSSTDGVGTKLKLARLTGYTQGLGVDLVGMNVNDILTLGAEPLFFLDYFAIGKIDKEMMKTIIKGIASGCTQAGCALIGGETAEMPGLYAKGDFDLAGFCVGVVDRDKIIDGCKVKAGYTIIGVASSGIHSNGFSFVRKVLKNDFIKEHAEEILKPTKIYVKPILSLIKKEPIFAMAHITGGGFFDNIPRVLPKGCGAKIHAGAWPIPRVFQWLQDQGNAKAKEMYRTFNMGIGMILVTPPNRARKVISHLAKFNEHAWIVGEIVKGEGVSIQ
ncbi:MAG: phosphoribosylformylglycinamidine cyclo-ligase [Candidatus Omnitrophica bacterium CG1_02_46_14]|nr:MAG: phosphoribosylformylglycinamidine cyclo-ligase [Candidatus Omnitrophica bacterium CG1_02_46_14]